MGHVHLCSLCGLPARTTSGICDKHGADSVVNTGRDNNDAWLHPVNKTRMLHATDHFHYADEVVSHRGD